MSPSPISRLETGERTPDLRTALLLEVVFGATASQLFRALYQQLAKKIRERAGVLDDTLKLQSETADVRRRRSELKAIIARIDRLGV